MIEHGHSHEQATGRVLLAALLLTAAILAFEAVAATIAHSLALLADAGHMLTDVFALGLAWFAVVQSRRPADSRRTYGYHRVGILAALINATALVLIVVGIVYEALRRLENPPAVQGAVVVVAALVAVGVNALIGSLLRGQRRNLNVRAALLHVVGDLVASAGVVLAGAIILLTGWTYADPAISIAIAALIAWGALRIVLETVNVLMEGTPRGIDLQQIRSEMVGHGVVSVHDLHVWSVSPEHPALSAHVVVSDRSLADAEHLVRDLEQRLCDRFGIGHSTIQVESCHPCTEIAHGATDHNHPHPATL
jgi:cobalt-zinc-cadmium efflux system protein